MNPEPCPFCLHIGVSCEQTSSHRWGAASCLNCGAVGPEIRREYMEKCEDWHPRAIKAWNKRDIKIWGDDDLPPLPNPLEIEGPIYNGNALGCGLEDHGIRDRYMAAAYGWEQGVDQVLSRVPEEIFSAEQMHAYALEAIKLSRSRSVP